MKKVTLVILSAALAGCATATRKAPLTGACPPCPQAAPAAPGAPGVTAVPAMLPTVPAALPPFADSDAMGPLLNAALLNRAYFQGLKSPPPDYDFAGRKVTAKQLADSNEEFIKIITSSPPRGISTGS